MAVWQKVSSNQIWLLLVSQYIKFCFVCINYLLFSIFIFFFLFFSIFFCVIISCSKCRKFLRNHNWSLIMKQDVVFQTTKFLVKSKECLELNYEVNVIARQQNLLVISWRIRRYIISQWTKDQQKIKKKKTNIMMKKSKKKRKFNN